MRAFFLFGRDKHKIKQNIKVKAPVKLADDLKSAVILAQKLARSGDAVIFSPATASFDMFKNAKERGKYFIKLIKSL